MWDQLRPCKLSQSFVPSKVAAFKLSRIRRISDSQTFELSNSERPKSSIRQSLDLISEPRADFEPILETRNSRMYNFSNFEPWKVSSCSCSAKNFRTFQAFEDSSLLTLRDDRTRPRPRVVWDTLRGSTLTHAHSRIPSVQTFELLQLKPSKLETFTRPTYELSNLRPPRLAEWGRVRRFSVFCSGGWW